MLLDRSKILIKNSSLGIIYKAINMIIVFVTIPLLLNYLEEELYGIWVTIFSLVNIFFFVDGGIGNGLKTKLSESLSIKNYKLSNEYISSAYFSISIISTLVLVFSFFLVSNLEFKEIFNSSLSNNELTKVFISTLILITISFVLNLYKPLYYANQKASKVELASLLYQLIILMLISNFIKFYPKDLLTISLIYGGANIFVSLLFTYYFFKENSKLKLSFKFFKRNRTKELMGLSIYFFIIQLSLIVIFTTDNLIISYFIGPSEVASYDVVYKLFQVFVTFSVIFQDPLWALYSDAYQKKDFHWIIKTLKKLNILFFIFIVLIVILYFFAKPIVYIWTQKDLNISNYLIMFMSFYVIVRAYGIIYMNFLNSIGNIKFQTLLFVFGALINIPLSIFFIDYLNFGNAGVILATTISLLSLSIALPIQTFKILKSKKNFNENVL